MDEAEELAEGIATALGTSLRHYMPATKAAAVSAAQKWIDRKGDAIHDALLDADGRWD